MRTGIRRKVDDLGRVVIPAGIRRTLGIREGDSLEVHVEGEQVIFAKPSDQCVFCGREEDLRQFRKRSLCRPCVAGVGVLDERIRDDRAPGDDNGAARHAGGRQGELPPWPVGSTRREPTGQRPPPAERPPASTTHEERSRVDADGAGDPQPASSPDPEPEPETEPESAPAPPAPVAQERPEPSDEREDPPASSTAW